MQTGEVSAAAAAAVVAVAVVEVEVEEQGVEELIEQVEHLYCQRKSL